MQRVMGIVLVFLLGAMLTGVRAESEHNSAVRAAVQALLTAFSNKDVDAMAPYLLPTVEGYATDHRFRVAGFQPHVVRDAFAEGFTSAVRIREVQVQAFEHAASVRIALEGTVTDTSGETQTGPWYMIQLWTKDEGTWKLEHYHGFPLLPWKLSAAKALGHATDALERFRDVAVAQAEGYVNYSGRDTFMMGEHWVNRTITAHGQCERTRPSHLQYLVIAGKRTLIGTGYVCGPTSLQGWSIKGTAVPPLFGTEITWHTHGPALCLREQGGTLDMRPWVEALPNALTHLTWEDLCQRWDGTSFHKEVMMMHAWNWIPQPLGAFVHENPAIPFLRAGLAVPTRTVLDSADGRAALDTLRLVHSDVIRRYRRAFPVVNASASQQHQTEQIVAQAVQQGQQALAQMRAGEAQDDRPLYLAGARAGTEALAQMRQDVIRLFSPAQQDVLKTFLASLHIRDHAHQRH